MLVLKKLDKEGLIKLKPEALEDLWHLEKIIKPGDLVSAQSTRKFEAESGTERKPVRIDLKVEKVEFHKGYGQLRVLGTIESGKPEEYIQLGEHHSLDFGEGDVITIKKTKWMKYELDRIKEAEESVKRPKIAVLTMDEREAELFVLREYGIDEKGKIFAYGGGKYTEERKDLKNKYFSEILELLKRLDTEKLIVAGTGFEPDNFTRYVSEKDQPIFKKMILRKTGWTGKSAIFELVNSGAIDDVVKEFRFSEEGKVIENLIREIASPAKKAAKGYAEVKKALEIGAVKVLLVLDTNLFNDRERTESLLEEAEKYNSKIMIISHENDAAVKLEAFGGVAALLRFTVSW
jgi:protein pelota